MLRMVPQVAALLALLGMAAAQGTNYKCRMGPDASHTGCGLPYELANFQGYFECDNSVKIGRPKNVTELQAQVAMYPHVKASGMGHSWWMEQFCSGNDSNSVNIVTTEQQAVLDFMGAPVDPQQWQGKQVPANFPIQVNELDEEVTVAAGITQRALLDYLSEYKYWKQPSGWTLAAFSWFLDQTIGGAVSTGTHGSSMKYGSLSSQLKRLKLVLANGTLLELSPKTTPHLFLAAAVNVGRLGVVTELTLKIKAQQAVQRTLQEMSFQDFAQQIKNVQDDFVKAKNASDVDGMKYALFQVDETQAFWALPTASVQRNDFNHLDHEPLAVLLNTDPNMQPTVQAMSGPEDDVYAQVEKKPVAANQRMTLNSRFWSNLYVTNLRNKVAPGTFESRKAFLTMAESETAVTSTFAPYDQYEVAIPMEVAGSCLMDVGKEVYDPNQRLWDGARTPFLIRFVTGEDFYLSPTVAGTGAMGPRMYINHEDYVSHSSGQPNLPFQRITQLFRERCGARLHWGKAGWPQHAKCFQGSKEYPSTWCHFGCAVQELDPKGKFASEWDGWKWSAAINGQAVPFASCCTATGFSSKCQCTPRTDC